MSRLPQRPLAHVNAQRSERAFAALFDDDTWIIRPVTPDYGRDLEVELFENGETTGILFGVQLKSIDKSPRKGRLSKPGIQTSSLRYWQSLDYPLLVATYSVPTDRIYARWAHSYDWHHKSHAAICTDECTPGPKTVTFHYGPTHLLTPEVVARFPEQLQFFRAARMGDLRHSRMPVRVGGESVDGHSPVRIAEELGRIGADSDWIRLAEPDELAVSLTYEPSKIRALLPGEMRSSTIHLVPGIYDDPDGSVALAADGIVALCWMFFMLKADTAAADLIRAVTADTRVLFASDAHLAVAPRLLEAGRDDVVEALAAEELRRLQRSARVSRPAI